MLKTKIALLSLAVGAFLIGITTPVVFAQTTYPNANPSQTVTPTPTMTPTPTPTPVPSGAPNTGLGGTAK
jgi:hypothetical protein